MMDMNASMYSFFGFDLGKDICDCKAIMSF